MTSPWRKFHPGLFRGAERTRQSCEERAERLAKLAIDAGLTPQRIQQERARGGQWLARIGAQFGFKREELQTLLDRWPVYALDVEAGS